MRPASASLTVTSRVQWTSFVQKTNHKDYIKPLACEAGDRGGRPPAGFENFQGNSVFQGKRKLLKNPEKWKIHIQYSEIRAPSVFQGKRKLLKNPECKKYIQHSEKFQNNSVFQGKRKLLKILNNKKYIQYCEFRAPFVFQGKRKLLKTPECKKCIQYSEKFLGNSVFFRASAVAQKSWIVKNIFNTVKNFRETLFSGQAKVVKNPECEKYIHYNENFQGNSVVFRASASCSKIVNCEKNFNAV